MEKVLHLYRFAYLYGITGQRQMQYVCRRMSRAALYKEPGSRVAAAASCLGRHAHPGWPQPQQFLPVSAVGSVRRCCCSNPPLHPFFKADKAETPVPGSDTGVLGGRGWTSRATHLKKPRRGFFTRRTVRRVDAVRIHPLYEFSLVTKQKPQRTCIR